MKCTEVKQNLDAFFDGEIFSTQKDLIETHLENCGFCQTEFENLQSVRNVLKQSLPVSASAVLDERVMSAFQLFHNKQRASKVEEKTKTEKIGWFAVPRFVFASALVLFALATISAFQLGRMSADVASVKVPQIKEKNDLTTSEFAGNNSEKEQDANQIKIVEVPVIREKIVKVPVIEEKIVIKTIYVTKDEENKSRMNLSENNSLALKNSVENNGYLTQTDLKGFQPVSEINLKISKEVDNNEK